MSCTLDEHKREIYRDHISGIFKTLNVDNLGKGAVVINYGKDNTIKTQRKAYSNAIQLSRELNRWSLKHYETSDYRGKWLSNTKVNKERGRIEMHFKFPKDAARDFELKQMGLYEKKDDREEYRETDYLMNEEVASPDSYHYSFYQEQLQGIRKATLQKRGILRLIPDKTKKDLEQISQLSAVLKVMEKDISYLDSGKATIDNVFSHFNRDLDAVMNTVAKNPTVVNLITARDFVDRLSFVHAEGEGSFSNNYFGDIKDPDTRAQFQAFFYKYSDVVRDLERAESTVYQQLLEDYREGEIKKDDLYKHVWRIVRTAEELKNKEDNKKGRDIALSEHLVLPIDEAKNSHDAAKLLRKYYDDTHAKKTGAKILRKLANIDVKVKNRLAELGYKNAPGVIGKLLPKHSFEIFFTKDSQNNHRLISPYSNHWTDLEAAYENSKTRRLKIINSETYSNVEKASKIKALNRKTFNTLNSGGAEFLDISLVPEIFDDLEFFNDFSNTGIFDNTTTIDAQLYKERTIRRLSGGSTHPNAIKNAKKTYEKLVKQQKEQLHSYAIDRADYVDNLLSKQNVHYIEDLNEEGKNKLNQFDSVNSPIKFMQEYKTSGKSAVSKEYTINGEVKMGQEYSSLEYNSYLPKTTGNFDNDFIQKIQNDDTLYEAWEVIDEAIDYINKNRKYTSKSEDSSFGNNLLYEYDFYRDNKVYSLSTIDRVTVGRIREALSTARFVDTERNVLRLHDKIDSIDEVVKKRLTLLTLGIKNNGVNVSIPLVSVRNKKHMEYLRKHYKSPLPLDKNTTEVLEEIAERDTLKMQKVDLTESLMSMVDVIQTFKANKEVESKMLFIQDSFQRFDNAKGNLNYQKVVIKKFIEKFVYGINNRENWSKGESKPYKVKSRNQADAVLLAEDVILQLENTIQGLSKAGLSQEELQRQHEELEEEKKAAQETINTKGRIIIVGSMVHGVFVKLPILTSLALTPITQYLNFKIGRMAGTINDGLLYESGSHYNAVAYNNKLTTILRFISRTTMPDWTPDVKGEIYKHNLSNTFINDIGSFQNSANEVDFIGESQVKSNVKKLLRYLHQPLYIVGATEKTIQRPQMHAMMQGIKVYDEQGVEYPLFDTETGTMPAFDLIDGEIYLAEGFNTPRNQATWIEKNNQEFADIFGNSGIIPKLISIINGDYRETSSVLAKDNAVGVQTMVFKTWVARSFQRQYNSEYGITSTLINSGRAEYAMAFSSLTALAGGAMASTLLFGSIAGPVVLMGYAAAQYFTLGYIKQYKELGYLMRNIKMAGNLLAFLGRTTAIAIASQPLAMVKTVQMLTGKKYIKDEHITKALLMKRKEGELDANYQLQKANVNAMLTKYVFQLGTVLSAIATNYAWFLYNSDDDDLPYLTPEEKKEREERRVLLEALYILSRNIQGGTMRDLNVIDNPMEAIKLLTETNMHSNIKKLTGLMQAYEDQIKGDTIFKSGIYKGQDKTDVALKKIFVLNAISDIKFALDGITVPSLGVRNRTKENFYKDALVQYPFRSDKEKITKSKAHLVEMELQKIEKKYIKKLVAEGDEMKAQDMSKEDLRVKARSIFSGKKGSYYDKLRQTVEDEDFTESGQMKIKLTKNGLKDYKSYSGKYDIFMKEGDNIERRGIRTFKNYQPWYDYSKIGNREVDRD